MTESRRTPQQIEDHLALEGQIASLLVKAKSVFNSQTLTIQERQLVLENIVNLASEAGLVGKKEIESVPGMDLY